MVRGRSMLKKISPLSILVGLLAVQGAGIIMVICMVICFFFIYGNKVLVAFLEYSSSIVITMILTLFSIFIGGYISMLFNKKSIINPFIIGLLSLAINTWFLYVLDFKYGKDHIWMLIITGILTIPSAIFGYYVYNRQHS